MRSLGIWSGADHKLGGWSQADETWDSLQTCDQLQIRLWLTWEKQIWECHSQELLHLCNCATEATLWRKKNDGRTMEEYGFSKVLPRWRGMTLSRRSWACTTKLNFIKSVRTTFPPVTEHRRYNLHRRKNTTLSLELQSMLCFKNKTWVVNQCFCVMPIDWLACSRWEIDTLLFTDLHEPWQRTPWKDYLSHQFLFIFVHFNSLNKINSVPLLFVREIMYKLIQYLKNREVTFVVTNLSAMTLLHGI